MKTLLRGLGFAVAAALLAAPSATRAASFPITGYNTAAFKMPGTNATHQGGSKPWNITTVNPGGSRFTWGKKASGSTGSRNYLEFRPNNANVGNQFNTFTDAPINLGTLDYFNGITATGSNVDHVDLIVSLTLTTPSVPTEVYDFQFQMLSRVNPDPDDVTFVSPTTSTSFTYNDVDYTLRLLGFSDDGVVFRDAFLSRGEGVLSTTKLWAIVTAVVPPPATVPEPASVISAATAGLVGLGLLARRRRRKETVA